MNSAFGIKLKPTKTWDGRAAYSGELPTGESVSFWLNEKNNWCGSLRCGGEIISETIGSASPEAAYRSLRGRVKNLRNALGRALGETK